MDMKDGYEMKVCPGVLPS